MQIIVTPSVLMLIVVMLSIITPSVFMLINVMLSVVMLSVVMLSVVMPNVKAPRVGLPHQGFNLNLQYHHFLLNVLSFCHKSFLSIFT